MKLVSGEIAFMYTVYTLIMILQRWCLHMSSTMYLNSSGALVAFWTPLRLLINPEPWTVDNILK